MTSRGAIVTGGGSGIGLAAARQLIADGWRVAIMDRDRAAFERAGQACADAGDGLVAIELDVTDEASVEAAVAEAEERIGPLRGLVNSAGVGQDKPFLDITAAEFRRILDINLVGTFLAARAAAARMRSSGGGAIVNIASINGIRGSIGRTAYGASKGGVITMTRVMAVELAEYGIRVNVVAPGPVETPLVAEVHTPEVRKLYRQTIPQRRYGTPEEMGLAIAFLLDEARSAYITGQVLGVDGGFLAAGLMREG